VEISGTAADVAPQRSAVSGGMACAWIGRGGWRMTPEELSIEQQRLTVERARLEIERTRASLESRFVSRHMGSLVTLIVSLAAVSVSVGQLLMAKQQQALEADRASRREQRELNLRFAEFISKNHALLFPTNEDKTIRMRNVLLVTFPPDITGPLFAKLEQAASSVQELSVWQEGLQQVASSKTSEGTQEARLEPDDEARAAAEPVRVFLHSQDENDRDLMAEMAKELRQAGYAVPSIKIVSQVTKGDVRYYHADEEALATSVREIVDRVLLAAKRPATVEMIGLHRIGGPFRNLPRNVVEVWVPRQSRSASTARREPRKPAHG
jgi:hypothetical protein